MLARGPLERFATRHGNSGFRLQSTGDLCIAPHSTTTKSASDHVPFALAATGRVTPGAIRRKSGRPRSAPWLNDMLKREPADAAHLIGDALAATNRVAMSDSKRLELAEKYWATANTLWPLLEKQFVRASHPLSGEALEAAKAALTLASELTTAYKHLLVNEADKRISLGGQRLMVALVHRCLQCTARILVNSYLSYRAGAAAHLARLAPHLHVRARSQHPPDAGRVRPARGHARAPHDPVAAARAGQSVRLPARPTADRAALRAGIRALGQAHRRRAGAPDGQGGGDRAGRPRLPAVFGEQGRLDRRQQALPADVRPRVPDPGAAARARSGRRRARRHRPRSGGAPAVHRAAEAAAAAMGHSAGAAVQPAAVARPRRHVFRPDRRLAIQPRRALGHSQSAVRPAADGQLPGDQSHARRLRVAPDRSGAGGAAHRRARSRCASRAATACRSRWCAGSATR